ncbi:DUF3768 domain-containing protein [Rhodomicrobium vannielii ATCC 17100]|uniref:DUF3768 domain-containing protein n=1 Tax=Rhodomicrobium vannielii TaxID=1069 RepID=UPI001918D5FC|nr:DUF3768 domain-containing protein [Rhodomicrobium vannielii]MBJ7533307.1 DUF3768 domain-containing protein [Rhodomicrobium vannielii ATCC 17100]
MSKAVWTPAQQAEYRAKVAKLNDAFRRSLHGGKVFITAGVAGLQSDVQALALRKVATYTDFDEGDNPWGERDFGAFAISGQKFFWKIDYYDQSMDKGSEDPSDPGKTTRVLTLMLAEEY